MKEGKSITQFTRQESLTGDELLLVNQIQSNGTYVSKCMRLSTLRDYINTETINDQPYPITPAYDGDEFVFNVPGDNQIRTLGAGTWECTIVGGGGGMFSKSIGYPRVTINRYRGHSSPMIKGTFTLDANTPCKFHVGDLPTIGYYTNTNTTSGEQMPTDNDGDSYVYEGDPSYILIGNLNSELTTSNSIVAVKAQKWYNASSASGKNSPWGWQYWDGQANQYNTRFSPNSNECEDGADGHAGVVSQYQGAIEVYPGKTTGTEYGRTPHMFYEQYTWWDEVCQTNQTGYRWINGTGTGGYIHVKRIS